MFVTPTRRDRQREETRRDLAAAALALATAGGLAGVRVPDIAAAVGVSTRTFNNYFSSREEAIAYPARRRAEQLGGDLLARPAHEPLGVALVAVIAGLYQPPEANRLPSGWLAEFTRLVATEPGLRGEYLKAATAGEQGLADAIVERSGSDYAGLRSQVLAAMVLGAERAAVMHRPRETERRLVDAVRQAVMQAVRGVDG